jgi:hypothetical protein
MYLCVLSVYLSIRTFCLSVCACLTCTTYLSGFAGGLLCYAMLCYAGGSPRAPSGSCSRVHSCWPTTTTRTTSSARTIPRSPRPTTAPPGGSWPSPAPSASSVRVALRCVAFFFELPFCLSNEVAVKSSPAFCCSVTSATPSCLCCLLSLLPPVSVTSCSATSCLCYLLSLLPPVSATSCLCYLLSLLPPVSATSCLCYLLSLLPPVSVTSCLCYLLSLLPPVSAASCLCYMLLQSPTTQPTNKLTNQPTYIV